jgi:hypothetical protein
LLARAGHCRTPAAPPTAQSAPSAASRETSAPCQPTTSTSAPVNPLREVPAAPAKSSAPREKAQLSPSKFVPNAGRLRLFRAADKDATGERSDGVTQGNGNATAPRGSLFPSSKLLATSRSASHVMRYEDVARGVPLVPVTPPRRVAPTSQTPVTKTPAVGTPSASKPLASASTSQGVPEMKVKRLPPGIRTAPRPQLPPGVELPQKPIEIYPDTGY